MYLITAAAGKPREAIDMYMHNQDWDAAMRVAEQYDPTAVMDIFTAQVSPGHLIFCFRVIDYGLAGGWTHFGNSIALHQLPPLHWTCCSNKRRLDHLALAPFKHHSTVSQYQGHILKQCLQHGSRCAPTIFLSDQFQECLVTLVHIHGHIQADQQLACGQDSQVLAD